MNSPVRIGNYKAVHCRSLTDLSSKTWWRVYFNGNRDGLSDHPTLEEATVAIRRYQAGDRRRAERL